MYLFFLRTTIFFYLELCYCGSKRFKIENIFGIANKCWSNYDQEKLLKFIEKFMENLAISESQKILNHVLVSLMAVASPLITVNFFS